MKTIHYIGIDISKNSFDMAKHNANYHRKFSNDADGISECIKELQSFNGECFVVLEATGGYEIQLLTELCNSTISVHRTDPLTSKNYIRSLHKRAKTDMLDAEALARYAFERKDVLPLFCLASEEQLMLSHLAMRRQDLLHMRHGEVVRAKHPNYKTMLTSLNENICSFEKQIEELEQNMQNIINNSSEMQRKAEIMQKMQGVGKKTVATLLAVMPELGTLSRRQAAALAGCAPHPRDSGKRSGYRSTTGGRKEVKKALFMAAMSARNHNPELREFHERLIKNGKKPMVALTAVMRKIITILNAQIRDDNLLLNHGR